MHAHTVSPRTPLLNHCNRTAIVARDGLTTDPVESGNCTTGPSRPRVRKILASQAWADTGLLFILWDEGKHSDGPIGMIVLSPKAKGGGYQNTIHYTHSSALRTIQEILGVSPLLGDAANATDLSDLFVSFP